MWSVEGNFSRFQWKSSEFNRNMCSEMGQFFAFCNVTSVDFLRYVPEWLAHFVLPSKKKMFCDTLAASIQNSSLDMCVTQKEHPQEGSASNSCSVYHLVSWPAFSECCCSETQQKCRSLFVFFFLCPWICFLVSVVYSCLHSSLFCYIQIVY